MAITDEMVTKALIRSLTADWEGTIGDIEPLVAGEYSALKSGDLTANYAIKLASGWRRDADCITNYANGDIANDQKVELLHFAAKLKLWADDFTSWAKKVKRVSTRG